VTRFGDKVEGPELIGRVLGPYQILTRIGAGGMGEVYRARDTRLNRDVALKILPAHSLGDPNLLLRFQREARLLATFHHPHIGAIYGFESADDIHALVLELIDGDTLAERLGKGALPLKDALVVARQIAEALDAAHSKGIIHRDLKPANIKITTGSVVKVLDFGLAKAISDEGNVDDENAQDVSFGRTSVGIIVGTPAYMSPEQARGEAVDKRTDIWAFGCVLYQMLTGRSAFGRNTMIDTLAAIVEGEADMSLLPADTSPQIRQLLERCLRKDVRQRLRDIGDGIALLEEAEKGPPAIVTKKAKADWLRWALIAVLFAAAGVGLTLMLRPGNRKGVAPVVRTTIVLPGEQKLVSTDRELPLAISPDGSRVAYVAGENGRVMLYVREMNSLEPRMIPGTDDARHPFFSPDGQSVGYFADGALESVSIHGGSPLRICDVATMSMGGSWGTDHTIVFASFGADLMRVSDSGGTPTPLAGTNPATWPEILPDGKTVLFTTGAGNNLSAFATVPLSGGPKRALARLAKSPMAAPTVIGSGGSLLEAHVVPNGYLLYGQSPGVIWAAPFNLVSNSITGSPIPLVGSIERALNGGGVYFAVSRTGTLVYAPTGNQHQLVWVDRKGAAKPIVPETGPYRRPRLSPNGKLLAFAASDDTRRDDIWVVDAETGTRRRLTTQEHNLTPTWSPDGTQITFSRAGGISKIPAGGGPVTDLVSGPGAYPGSWSPDGKNLIYVVNNAAGIAAWMLTPGTPGNPPGRLLSQNGVYFDPQYSPDGRWIAYSNGTLTRQAVYVARAPDLSDPILVSTGEGIKPVWSRDGRELFYRDNDAMMRVSLDTRDGFHAGKPERLFTGNFSGESHDSAFDISLDGQQFVMVKSDEAASLTKLTVVQNWPEELQKSGTQ
jgi:eukaryotic-like serine/threonine-protein kinase